MNAETVYQVAKALPEEEQRRLLDRLKKDFKPKLNRRKQKTLMTDEEALDYLLENVFNISRTNRI